MAWSALAGGFNMVWMICALDEMITIHWAHGSFCSRCYSSLGPLPVAIAAGRGTFWQAGAGAVRCLWRCGFAMVSWALTAVLVLGLTRYVGVVLQESICGGKMAWLPVLLGSVTSALLGTWLLVAVMLVFYRQVFRPKIAAPPEFMANRRFYVSNSSIQITRKKLLESGYRAELPTR